MPHVAADLHADAIVLLSTTKRQHRQQPSSATIVSNSSNCNCNGISKMAEQKPPQPKLKLCYFNIAGKGEPIRLYCKYAGLEFEDYRFADRAEFQKLKEDGTLPFGQVPLLEVDGGKHKLVQSSAILRYLSRIAGLYPTDPLIAAKVDAVLEQEVDAFIANTVATYTTRFGIPLDEDTKKKAYSMITDEVTPRHLSYIERLLESSQTGYLANTAEPSIADFAWFYRLGSYLPLVAKDFAPHLASLEQYPACRKFVAKMKDLDAVKEFYADSK